MEDMECPTCNRIMAPIKADTGLWVLLDSFYCKKCDTSITDREAVEEMIDKIKPGRCLVVNSHLRASGAAA